MTFGPRTGVIRPIWIGPQPPRKDHRAGRSKDGVFMVTIPRPTHGARWSVTVARRTPRGTVTVPVAWLTVPVEEVAMLRTKDGSWKRTGPLGVPPRRVNETDRPDGEMLRRI